MSLQFLVNAPEGTAVATQGLNLKSRPFGPDQVRRRLRSFGFSLIELMIVTSIIGVLGSVFYTKYAAAIRTARIEKSKQELRALSFEIDVYMVQNGIYPDTLWDVGRGGKLDPWGNPYMYLNFQRGTGSAVEFVMTNGLVDPIAVEGWNEANAGAVVGPPVAGAGNGGNGGNGNAFGQSGAGNSSAAGQTGTGNGNAGGAGNGQNGNGNTFGQSGAGNSSAAGQTGNGHGNAGGTGNGQNGNGNAFGQGGGSGGIRPETSPASEATVEKLRRKDEFLFPLNTDYDLFSVGPNGKGWASITKEWSLDDVIRANNGGFIGTASEY